MKEDRIRETLENTVDLCGDGIKDHTDCQECGEDYLFLMKDKDHEFSIGLRTILSCLAIAEKEEAVPKLPGMVVENQWEVLTEWKYTKQHVQFVKIRFRSLAFVKKKEILHAIFQT